MNHILYNIISSSTLPSQIWSESACCKSAAAHHLNRTKQVPERLFTNCSLLLGVISVKFLFYSSNLSNVFSVIKLSIIYLGISVLIVKPSSHSHISLSLLHVVGDGEVNSTYQYHGPRIKFNFKRVYWVLSGTCVIAPQQASDSE